MDSSCVFEGKAWDVRQSELRICQRDFCLFCFFNLNRKNEFVIQRDNKDWERSRREVEEQESRGRFWTC